MIVGRLLRRDCSSDGQTVSTGFPRGVKPEGRSIGDRPAQDAICGLRVHAHVHHVHADYAYGPCTFIPLYSGACSRRCASGYQYCHGYCPYDTCLL